MAHSSKKQDFKFLLEINKYDKIERFLQLNFEIFFFKILRIVFYFFLFLFIKYEYHTIFSILYSYFQTRSLNKHETERFLPIYSIHININKHSK